MEDLPGFAAVADAEEALCAALEQGGLVNAAFAIVAGARELRAAWSFLVLSSPAEAEAAGGLSRCAAACEGRAKAKAAEAGGLPLQPASSAAAALRALLADADVAYAAIDAALEPRCAALPGAGGGAGAGVGDTAAVARLRADARMRRGDARRYAAEALEEGGSEAWLAALDGASAFYGHALLLWPHCGRARNLLGVAALARGDEAEAVHCFLAAQHAGAPFAAAAANAAPLLAAAASRPLLSADAAGDALGGLAETRLLRCVGAVLLPGGAGTASFDTRGFETAAKGAASSLQAALEAGTLPPAAALRCVVAVAAAVRSAAPRAWRQSALRLPPENPHAPSPAAWPPRLLAALRIAGDLAPPLLRAAAAPEGRYLAAAVVFLGWLQGVSPLVAAPPFRLRATRCALAQLLNAPPLRAAAAVGESLGPCAIAAALPEDSLLRGLVPFAPALACRVFAGGEGEAGGARAVPGTRARAMRAARVAALGAWAASDATAGALVGYDPASAAYTDADGVPPPPLAPPPPPPPKRFPQPPPAPLPPPAPALRHSLSFAALSLGGPIPRVPSFSSEGDIWAPLPAEAAVAQQQQQAQPQPQSPPRRARGPPPPDAPGGDPLHAAAGGLGPQLVVLDAPNVAMRAGRGQRCSVAGLTAAVEFWRRRGHVVVAFCPAAMLVAPDDPEAQPPPRRAPAPPGGVSVASSGLLPPDDPAALLALAAEGLLISTPPGDYDDAYALAYARRHGGVLVSNDRFGDAVATAPPGRRRDALRAWLRARVCTFAFAGAEFLPNPAFSFWAAPEEARDVAPEEGAPAEELAAA